MSLDTLPLEIPGGDVELLSQKFYFCKLLLPGRMGAGLKDRNLQGHLPMVLAGLSVCRIWNTHL